MIEIRGLKTPVVNSIEVLERKITKKLRLKQVPEYMNTHQDLFMQKIV